MNLADVEVFLWGGGGGGGGKKKKKYDGVEMVLGFVRPSVFCQAVGKCWVSLTTSLLIDSWKGEREAGPTTIDPACCS